MQGDLRKALEYVLHWNFFSVVGALVVGGGIAVIGFQQFGLGYGLFAFTTLWAMGHWLTSDFLKQKRQLISLRGYRRDPVRLKRARVDFWGWLLSVIALLSVLGGVCELWVLDTKQGYERDDAFNHLSIDYSIPPGAKDDPLKSIISITNNSSEELSDRHRISCKLNMAANDLGYEFTMHNAWITQNLNGWSLLGGDEVPIKSSQPIHSGGDAESDSCLGGFKMSSRFACADATIRFEYYLEDQPTSKQQKETRVVTYGDPTDGFQWYKEQLEKTGSYCGRFVKQRQP